MDSLLQIAGLCALSLFLAWRLVAPLTAPFWAISCTALFQLVFALAHLYTQGKVIWLGSSLLLGSYTLISLLRTERAKLAGIAKPILIFGFLLGFLVWHYANARVVYWDEFYWAAFVKHLVLENGLWDWTSVLPRKDSVLLYPPGITILQALFQPMGHFSESRIAVAETAVMLSACGIVLHVGLPRIQGRLEQCCLILGSFVVLRSLGARVWQDSYLFAYGEALQLAFYVSPVLMAVFCFSDMKKRLWLWGGSLLLLSLCKPTGFVLAGFAIGAIALVQLVKSGDVENTNLWGTIKRGFLPALKMGLMLFLPCVLVWLGWQMYVKCIVLGDMQSQFSGIASHSLAGLPVVAKSYIKAFFVKSLFAVPCIWQGKYVSTNFAFFAGMGAMLWYACKYVRPKPKYLLLPAYFLVTWIVWLLVHGYVLLFYMTAEEQGYAASFERYMAVVLGPALLAAIVLFLQAASLHGKRLLKRCLQICLALMVVHTLVFACMRPHDLPVDIADMREAATFLQNNVPSGSTYLIVTGNPKYELNNACQLYVMPDLREAYVESSGSFSPHTTRMVRLSLGDLPGNFRELARKYSVDYLLLWHFDTAFTARFGKILGLTPMSKAPILLDLKAWRNGAASVPETVGKRQDASSKSFGCCLHFCSAMMPGICLLSSM